MLSIVGLIAGIALGGMIGDGMGAIAGGALGAFLGYAWWQRTKSEPRAAQVDLLERKVTFLKEQLDQALLRLDELEAAQRAQPADAVQAVQAESAVVTEVPTPLQSVTPPPPEPSEAPTVSAPAPLRPAQPRTIGPVEPSLFDTALSAIKNWFMGGNTVVRVGIVILFFGVAFLLKYAYDHAQVPPELRIAGVAIGGVALLVLGWRFRRAREGFALALQGGGVGVLYLTIFAALRLYNLLPPSFAFGLLLCIAAFSAVLAVVQNAQALAVLGASGGFLAPILASTGQGSHVMLFSYYVMLNLGILGIAWFKAWRPLNVVGFLFTFGIGMAWGAKFYRPEFFGSTEPFLIVFFLMYLAVAVLFASRRAPQLKHYLDGTLTFGLPIVAFGLQVGLVSIFEYGAAVSALALSFLYLVLARVSYARHREDLRDLVEAFLALGVVFATLTIPLALDGRWTSAAWAFEGAAILWVGIRQERLLARVFGLFLQVAAAGAFLTRFGYAPMATPVLNSFFVGALFLSVAGLFSNWIMQKHRDALRDMESTIAVGVFVWGALWWVVAGISEIDRHLPAMPRAHVQLIFIALSCVAFGALHRRLDWPLARFPMLVLLPFALMVLLADMDFPGRHPSVELGWLAWPLVFVSHLRLLKKHELQFERIAPLLHAAGLWLLAAVGAWECAWWIDHWVAATKVWGLIAWVLVPAGLVFVLGTRGERMAWPVAAHLKAYLLYGALPLVAVLGMWLLYSNASNDGNPWPLPYVPVLSPLDLAQLGVLLISVYWFKGCEHNEFITDPAWRRLFYIGLGIGGFICANGILLRTLHHWAGVPFDIDEMLESMLVQASFSIFWTVLALCTMVLATRLHRRALWITGAGLMGVVVAKLFLVDLSNIGGVERIVSFIGVGLLMLVVGYFSPVPPKKAERAS